MHYGFFSIDSSVLAHLGTLRIYILAFSTFMRAKINSFLLPQPKGGINESPDIQLLELGFKKNNKHHNWHDKVMRIGNCLDFMVQKSSFYSH